MLGVSSAEFDTLTAAYKTALDVYSASAPTHRAATLGARSAVPNARDQALIGGFATALTKISPKDAVSVLAYMNGQFRANVKSRLASGKGTK